MGTEKPTELLAMELSAWFAKRRKPTTVGDAAHALGETPERIHGAMTAAPDLDCEVGGPLEKRHLLPFEPEEGDF